MSSFDNCLFFLLFFFFSSRRRHTRCLSDWSSDVCSSDLRRDLDCCGLRGISPATEGRIARVRTSLLMDSPHRKAASLAETVLQNGHQTAAPSALLPSPHGELRGRSSAECRGDDRHPPTIPAAVDAPTPSGSQARFLLTPITVVASGSVSPACPIPQPPAPRGAPAPRSFLAPQISSGARPYTHPLRSAPDRRTETAWLAC